MKKLFILLLLLFAPSACIKPKELTPKEVAMREIKLRELLKHGNAELRKGTWEGFDQAQADYSTARDLSPEDPRVIDGLGCVAWRKGNAELAEFYFRRARELNQNYDRPLVHLALIAESRGHREAAEGLLRRAMRTNPLNYKARNNYAALLLNTNETGPRIAEAQRELLKARELADEEDPIVSGNLNILNSRSGW